MNCTHGCTQMGRALCGTQATIYVHPWLRSASPWPHAPLLLTTIHLDFFRKNASFGWRGRFAISAICRFCAANRIAPFSATRGAAICNHMNRNLEDLIPILLLPGCERELCATLHALVMLVHIPQGRTVGTMRGVLRHIRLNRAFRHLFDTIIVIRLVNGRRPAWFGLFGASHQEFAEYRLQIVSPPIRHHLTASRVKTL